MSKKHLDYLLTLNSYNKKLKLVSEGNHSAFFEVRSKITVFKKIAILFYKREVIELELLPGTIIHIEKDTRPLKNPYYNWDSNKCRVTSAYYPVKNSKGKRQPVGRSIWDGNYNYLPGQMLFPTGRYSAAYNICARGIHCFLTWQEAEDYVL